MSKSIKTSSSSPLSSSSDPGTRGVSLDCSNDEALKSRSLLKKELDKESENQESLEKSSPEV